MKKGKVWGETTRIYQDNHVSVHLLRIKKGGFSSEHRHKHKLNYFFLLSGRVTIKTWMDETMDETILSSAHETTSVPTGHWHQFYAEMDSVMLEFYIIEPLAEDIDRRSVGGKI